MSFGQGNIDIINMDVSFIPKFFKQMQGTL